MESPKKKRTAAVSELDSVLRLISLAIARSKRLNIEALSSLNGTSSYRSWISSVNTKISILTNSGLARLYKSKLRALATGGLLKLTLVLHGTNLFDSKHEVGVLLDMRYRKSMLSGHLDGQK